MAADRALKWSTSADVIGVVAVVAVASFEHGYVLVRAQGGLGERARLVPLTVDDLIYANSAVMLDSTRWKVSVSAFARWLLGLGIAATLAVNVAYGLRCGRSAPSAVHCNTF